MAGWGLSGSRRRRTGLSAATVGWSDAGRRACLHRVVCLSRFLVRPGVECRTSHVLGSVVRRVGDDFEARYGYRPYLLETFVDRHAGTGFQASNWRGETAGRGRQGHAATETPKACVRGGLADAHSGAACAACAVGGRIRSGELGGTGVRRCAAGGCASKRTSSDLAPGGSADAGVHVRCEGGP